MPVIARSAALATAAALIVTGAWPLLFVVALPPELQVAPTLRVGLLLLALSLALGAVRQLPAARHAALAALVLAGLVLFGWLATTALGLPAPGSFAAKAVALRPTLPLSVALALLAAALWLPRDDEAPRFDLGALAASLASGLALLVCLGHLYGARRLVHAPLAEPSSGLGALLLLVLAVATLAIHPGGPVAAYAGNDPGAVTRRRLLPAAVLVPIASGFLVLYAITSQALSPTLAVALVAFANVLVMLLLIEATGSKVARVVQDRQARMEAREAQARKQGMRDAMTALLNRRGWDAEVQAAERRCRAEGLDACVVVIDLDGLKQVNDTEGHKAGDAYIQRAAAALRKAARRGDTLARVGGDEFACLVADCDEETAQAVVERFRENLRSGRVSASVGYAMRGERAIGDAFEQADQEMYRQKRARKLRRA